MPLRFTTVEEPVVELLVMVNVPDAAPATVGSNWMLSGTIAFGLRVTGKPWPETEKPLPETWTEVIVNAEVPVDFRMSV